MTDDARRAAAREFLDSLPEVDEDIETVIANAQREAYERVFFPPGQGER